ncbi:MAG TPA: SdiA-regulated domain-containing protein [Steroidobacteraceae bacterium]|nr:SdiA-regulated domain-containing protein [Steroidobacteraceae bacterium]
MRFLRTTTVCLALAAPALSQAAVDSIDLSRYRETGTYALPAGVAAEASAVAYNRDRNSLFVVGDEGNFLVEVSLTGTLLGAMSLSGFDDTEGLTYIGNGKFIITEERIQDGYVLSYTPGGSATRSALPWVSIGPTLLPNGNIGIEGISYDPTTGNFVLVKEKDPQAVYEAQLTFATGATGGTANVTSLFTPALGVTDLSDVQVLSGVVTPGSPDAQNLLIYSQESRKLLEVTRSGDVLSMFTLGAGNAEGVTIDDNGTIYIVDESPFLHVLTPEPVPLPAAAWLLLSGLGGLGALRMRGRNAA